MVSEIDSHLVGSEVTASLLSAWERGTRRPSPRYRAALRAIYGLPPETPFAHQDHGRPTVVGAYVLAGELAASPGDHRLAYARYERELRDFVNRGQKLAKANAGGLLPRSRSQIWLRNQAIRALPYLPWRGMVAGGVQKAANAISLKDYPSP